MDIAQATKIIGAETPAAAGARCIIKRTLRKQRLPADLPHDQLAGYFIANPWACTGAIERTIHESARAWERDDNERENLLASHVECLFALLDVTLDWPGLYPCYHYTGTKPDAMPAGLFARDMVDLSGLWSLLRDIRKYA